VGHAGKRTCPDCARGLSECGRNCRLSVAGRFGASANIVSQSREVDWHTRRIALNKGLGFGAWASGDDSARRSLRHGGSSRRKPLRHKLQDASFRTQASGRKLQDASFKTRSHDAKNQRGLTRKDRPKKDRPKNTGPKTPAQKHWPKKTGPKVSRKTRRKPGEPRRNPAKKPQGLDNPFGKPKPNR